MELAIKRQEKFSRGQLLLRTFFGWIYILIPHYFLLFFVGIWSMILSFLAFWAVLFTGKYPKSWYEYQIKLMTWGIRVSSSFFNLIDGYPQFGLNGSNPQITLDAPYPEKLSRGILILRLFFGWIYIFIPHGFCLYFRILWGFILMFIAWWVVLFTGKYPEGLFNYQAGTLRWAIRLGMYASFLTDKYPPFSGK